MGFFDRLRQKRETETLEQALRANPSPALHVELAEHLIAAGDVERAFEIARAGKEAFPASEAVFQLYASLKKRQSQDQIRALQRQIETAPSASTYGQLAALYREVHEEERAIDLCREAIEKYPADDGPHQVLGEIRLARFHAEKHRRDGRLAIDHLEKAAERNEKNYKALLALARLYLEIGAVGHCLKRVRQIQTFAPADPALSELLDRAAACPKPETEDLDELLRQVESAGKMTVRIDATRTKKAPRTTQKKRLAARTGFDPERVEREIDSLRHLSGVSAVGFLGEDGRLLAFRGWEGEKRDFPSGARMAPGVAVPPAEGAKPPRGSARQDAGRTGALGRSGESSQGAPARSGGRGEGHGWPEQAAAEGAEARGEADRMSAERAAEDDPVNRSRPPRPEASPSRGPGWPEQGEQRGRSDDWRRARAVGQGGTEAMSAGRFEEGIAEFAGSAATHSQKLDIGTLVSAEIAGPFGQILVYHLEKAVLGLYLTEPQPPDRIGGQVRHFVDRCYAGPPADEGGEE
ncbi:MAG: tetratricopeptide repeat protein [Planctomycetes bacterium]|nr:tetratricopeptide repeat protein [Planctomycetota bacterium]